MIIYNNKQGSLYGMNTKRKKFASQADPKVLSQIRKIANDEGKQFQFVLDEAMRDYISKKHGNNPRINVLSALKDSMNEYDELYKLLAK